MAGAVASICTSYLDREGKEVGNSLSRRFIGVSLEELKRSRVIAVAIGEKKGRSHYCSFEKWKSRCLDYRLFNSKKKSIGGISMKYTKRIVAILTVGILTGMTMGIAVAAEESSLKEKIFLL